VLATSRARLLTPYEHVYAVPGMSTPDGVSLFNARAAAAGAAFLDGRRVAVLCRALDGMALAIELAAARCASLGLDGLEAGLDQRLRFLTAGGRVADRHRSLRNAIAWSYDLLGPDDRRLVCTVSVFAGWFDVAAAAVLAGIDPAIAADRLARLADHSLLLVDRGTVTRYRALETIRQFDGRWRHSTPVTAARPTTRGARRSTPWSTTSAPRWCSPSPTTSAPA
jgi:predicted ATPase